MFAQGEGTHRGSKPRVHKLEKMPWETNETWKLWKIVPGHNWESEGKKKKDRKDKKIVKKEGTGAQLICSLITLKNESLLPPPIVGSYWFVIYLFWRFPLNGVKQSIGLWVWTPLSHVFILIVTCWRNCFLNTRTFFWGPLLFKYWMPVTNFCHYLFSTNKFSPF